MKTKKINWKVGDVFTVSLDNGRVSIGHVLGQSMANTVRIALYEEVFNKGEIPTIETLCKKINLISLIEVTKEQLTYGVWEIIGNKPVDIPIGKQPNEEFRKTGWVGAKIRDAALAEDFLNAFYGMAPWDDWGDPNYLDAYLVSIDKKPRNLVYIKS